MALGCAGNGGERRFEPGSGGAGEEIALLVEGSAVRWPAIRARLAETGGAAALRDLVLDRAVEREAAARGVRVGQDELDRERRLFVEQLARAGQPGVNAAALLEQVRAARGLGPERFAALLRRNALLRALVAGGVEVREEEVELAHAVRYGERRVARFVLTATEQEAGASRRRVLSAGPGRRVEAVAREAIERSIDPTGPGGGLTDPISVRDPAYPEVVRAALGALEVGGVSPVLALEDGYGYLILERVEAAETRPLDELRVPIKAELRRRKERLAMQRLAQRLAAEADVTVLDPSLGWAWETTRSR